MDFFRGLFKDSKQDETSKQSFKDDLNHHFPAEQIRVLIYKDGSKLLFDSQAMPERQTMPPSQKKPNLAKGRDDMFGDMMLGAVPLAMEGITTKFHHFSETSQVLISKLFYIIVKRRVSNFDDDEDPDEKRRHSHVQERAKTASGTSTNTSPPVPRRQSVSASAYSVKPQRITYALGVVFTYTTPTQYSMLHTHFSLIDVKIKKIVRVLKTSLESRFTSSLYSSQGSTRLPPRSEMGGSLSRTTGANLNQTTEIKQAVGVFEVEIQTLFGAPRLENPIWSTVSAATKGRLPAYSSFLNALKVLDSLDDVRGGNGFLSTLITGLLSHNLSWLRFLDLSELYIPEVAKIYLDKNRGNTSSHQNPMMWQLEDLYGLFGSKNSITRTVLMCEKGTTHLNELLLVFSYFLRCTQVCYPPTPDSPGRLYEFDSDDALLVASSNLSPNTPIKQPNGHPTSGPPASRPPLGPSSFPASASDSASDSASFSQFGSCSFIDTALPHSHNFSFSLYGGLYPGFAPDMAVSATLLNRDTLIPKVLADMRTWMDHSPFCNKLQSANCIIANLSSRTCEVLTYCPSPPETPQDELLQTLDSAWFSSVPTTVNREVTTETLERSEYVASTLASVRELWLIGIPPETCIMFLEDRLRNLYIRSASLAKQLLSLPRPSRLTFSEVAELVGCGTTTSDVHLLVSMIIGVLQQGTMKVTTLKEIGVWWLLVEEVPAVPVVPSGGVINKLAENFDATVSLQTNHANHKEEMKT